MDGKQNEKLNAELDEFAKSNGKASAKEMYDEEISKAAQMCRDGDYSKYDLPLLNKMVMMVVMLTVGSWHDDFDYEFFNSKCYIGKITGNTYQHVMTLPRSGVNFEDATSSFTPKKINDFMKNNEVFNLTVKNADGTWAKDTTLKAYNVCFQIYDLYQNFINGTLENYVMKQTNNYIGNPYRLEMTDMYLKEFTKDETFNKKITGTQTDLFKTVSEELIPLLVDFRKSSSKYNINPDSKLFIASKKSDVIMLINPKTLTKIETVLMSQTFNNGKIDLHNYVDKIYDSPYKLLITEGQNKITVDNDNYYVPEDVIYVIDTSWFLKLMSIFEFSGTQKWIQNMSQSMVFYNGYVKGNPPWGKCFKFTSPGLKTSE